MEPNPESTFVAYSILYHEAVCVALLELVMYHSDSAESLSDFSVDLLDYACGLAAHLLVVGVGEASKGETAKDELQRQQNELAFDLGIRALTIIRYVAGRDGLQLNKCNRVTLPTSKFWQFLLKE